MTCDEVDSLQGKLRETHLRLHHDQAPSFLIGYPRLDRPWHPRCLMDANRDQGVCQDGSPAGSNAHRPHLFAFSLIRLQVTVLAFCLCLCLKFRTQLLGNPILRPELWLLSLARQAGKVKMSSSQSRLAQVGGQFWLPRPESLSPPFALKLSSTYFPGDSDTLKR